MLKGIFKKKRDIDQQAIDFQSAHFPELEFTRKRAKYLRLVVTASGKVRCTVPIRASNKDVTEFIEKNKSWIQLQVEKNLKARTESPFLPKSDDQLLLRGVRLQFVMSPEKTKIPYVDFLNQTVSWHKDLTDEKWKLGWYKFVSRDYITRRTHELAGRHGFVVKKIAFRFHRSKWGSCSSQGNLNFNVRLIHAPDDVIDYLIIHELTHTIHFNHSKDFWNHVEQICPHARLSEKWLNSEGILLLQ